MPKIDKICDKTFLYDISKINFELFYIFKEKPFQINLFLAVLLLLTRHHYIQLCIRQATYIPVYSESTFLN